MDLNHKASKSRNKTKGKPCDSLRLGDFVVMFRIDSIIKAKKKSRSKSKQRKSKRKPFPLRRILRWSAYAAAAGILVILLMFMVVSKYPSVGAEGADWLRGIIGDKAVAGLEMVVFQIQDFFQMWKYQLGIVDPAEEWASLPSPSASPSAATETNTPAALSLTSTPVRITTVQPTFTATPTPWQPAAVFSLALATGEGIWIPYLQGAQGHTVAYQAFVQPDPDRPYTRVAIVAMDLTRTNLHYVLGATEPALPDTPVRPGKMPDADRAANILLAEFNGGFQARHGQFGAMADGIQALPPRDGLGTVVIYLNGEVRLGEWGTDLYMSPNIVSFRQNGPLVIDKGEISSRIYNNSPQDWGYTVNDVSPTVRSGIGLSRDNKTLYYFCGPSLTMEALAKSMQAAGAYNAIQLDINNYWVLFVKITLSGSELVAEPLLPRLMIDGVDRYLTQSPRDFFYLTSLADE